MRTLTFFLFSLFFVALSAQVPLDPETVTADELLSIEEDSLIIPDSAAELLLATLDLDSMAQRRYIMRYNNGSETMTTGPVRKWSEVQLEYKRELLQLYEQAAQLRAELKETKKRINALKVELGRVKDKKDKE